MKLAISLVACSVLALGCLEQPQPIQGVEQSAEAICYEPPDCGECYINSGFGGCLCTPICPNRAHAISTGCYPTCTYTCSAGWYNCNGSWSDGCESQLNTVTNCGACGRTCTPPPGGSAQCVAGNCYYSCASGTTLVCQ
jgi:hypothetical protein